MFHRLRWQPDWKSLLGCVYVAKSKGEPFMSDDLEEVDDEEETMEYIDRNQWWQDLGYLAGKPIVGGLWIVLIPMIFTYRLAICDRDSVHDFYCYPKEQMGQAWDAFNAWDGDSDPIDGWVKHFASGRRPGDPYA